MQYSVFSDESYTTAERYRSIAAFSFPNEYFEDIDSNLKEIFSNVRLGFCMHLKTVKKIKKSEFYA
jgi:hypothetical protein